MSHSEEIHTVDDLRYRRRLIAKEIKEKELQIKSDFEIMRSKLTFMSIASEGLKLGMGGIKDIFKREDDLTPVRREQRLGLVSSILKFGTFKLGNVAAEKIAEGISNIFTMKKSKRVKRDGTE